METAFPTTVRPEACTANANAPRHGFFPPPPSKPPSSLFCGKHLALTGWFFKKESRRSSRSWRSATQVGSVFPQTPVAPDLGTSSEMRSAAQSFPGHRAEQSGSRPPSGGAGRTQNGRGGGGGGGSHCLWAALAPRGRSAPTLRLLLPAAPTDPPRLGIIQKAERQAHTENQTFARSERYSRKERWTRPQGGEEGMRANG